MPKNKTPQPGPEFSKDREFTAVLEDLRSQFLVFGEGLTDVQEKVSRMAERLERVEEDVSVIKVIIPTLASKKDLTEAITKAIQPLATKKELTEAIQPLATKKDLEKLEKFEKRLTALETH